MTVTAETIEVCVDNPRKHSAWKKASKDVFPYRHGRPLPMEIEQRAIDYISVLVKQFPFQLQFVMALPLWERFAQAWCETGDEQKAMRDI